MAECPKCGKVNYTPFCINCGAQIIFKCKKCGVILNVTQKYCGWCGEKSPFYIEEEKREK